jgi:hypothetical protein
MNKTGRFTLIKTTLTAMPIYTPINLELQIWLLKGMTKLMKGFLWSGTEVAQGGGGGQVPRCLEQGPASARAGWHGSLGSTTNGSSATHTMALATTF